MPTGSLVFQDDFASGVIAGRSIAGQPSVWEAPAYAGIVDGRLVATGESYQTSTYAEAFALTGLGAATEISVVASKDPTKYAASSSPYVYVSLQWMQEGGNYTLPYWELDGLVVVPSAGDHTAQVNYYNDDAVDEYSPLAVVGPLFASVSTHKITVRWDLVTVAILIDDVLVSEMDVSVFTPARTTNTNSVAIYIDGFRVESMEVLNADGASGGLAVSGFQATAFGTPSRFPRTEAYPDGFSSTQFATPSAAEVHPAASPGRITRFGNPFSPVTQTVQAEGFSTTRFGQWTYGQQGLPPGRFGGVARGFSTSQFGSPGAAMPYPNAVAAGFSGTQFGTPALRLRLAASGFSGTQFGTPVAHRQGRVSGFEASAFGSPTVRLLQPATGFAKTRFGTPVAELSNVYKESGFSTTRFSRPTARTGTFRQATGFNVAQFGTPASWGAYRALHVPPGVMFGKPLLSRNILC